MRDYYIVEIASYWNESLLDLRHAWPGRDVTVDIPSPRLELLRWRDGRAFADGAELPVGESRELRVGEMRFVYSWVEAPLPLPTALLARIDAFFSEVLGLSFAAHAGFAFALLLTPAAVEAPVEELSRGRPMIARFVPAEPLTKARPGGGAKGEPGVHGPKDRPRRVTKEGKGGKGAPILSADLLKALSAGPAGRVLGEGLGTRLDEALRGITRQAPAGDPGGSGGWSTRGAGPGGGGDTLDIGDIGLGPGGLRYGANGTAPDGDVPLTGGPKERVPVEVRRTVTQGCLSPEVALSRIHGARNEARYCYERELTKDPNLAGKVTTVIDVGPTGSVTRVRIAASTVKNPALEQCLVRMAGRLLFPPCKGGGTAQVTYPWLFSSTGGSQVAGSPARP